MGLELKKKSDLGLQQLPQKLLTEEGCLGQFSSHDVMEATPLRSRSTQLSQIHRSMQQSFSPGTNCGEGEGKESTQYFEKYHDFDFDNGQRCEKTSHVFLNN